MEEYRYIRVGDMYVKDFKVATIKTDVGYWRVRKEISLINDKSEAIPIEKEEAQGLMKLLDRTAVLVDLGGNDE